MKNFFSGICIAATIFLGGCANMMSIYREFTIDAPKGISIDAKQRVVVVTNETTRTFDKDNSEARIETSRSVVCAEPSPDAVTTLATSLSLSGQTSPDKILQAAMGTSEQGGYVGLRTQSIQLLRDAMYRLCEGYLAGALEKKDFARLQRRYQNLMLGLLAIEQLTGATATRQVVMSGNATASAGEAAREELDALVSAKSDERDKKKALDTAKSDVETLQKTLTQAKADADAAGKKDQTVQANKDAKTKADAAVDDATKKLADAQDVVKNKQDAYNAALDKVKITDEALRAARNRVRAAASGSPTFGPSIAGGLHPSSVKEVATAVTNIVTAISISSFGEEECLLFLTNATAGGAKKDNPAVAYCNSLLGSKALEYKVQTQRLEQMLK